MRILGFCFCLLINTTLWADEFRVVQLNTDNGLSNNIINGVTQDKDGFLWVVTADGLCRYDGYKFNIFKPSPNKQSHIGESVLFDELVDSNGNLWIAAENLHLYQSQKETFIQFTKPFEGKIQHISEISHGIILLQCSEPNGLWIFNLKEKQFYDCNVFLPKELKNLDFIASFADSKGQIWLSCYSKNTLYQLTITEKKETWQLLASYVMPQTILSFNKSVDGKMIMGSNNGNVFSFQNNQLFRICNLANFNGGHKTVIQSMVCESKDVYWLGTDVGLFRYAAKENTFEKINFYSSVNILQANSINHLFIDAFQQLWVSTSSGLSRINLWRNPIKQYKTGIGRLPDNQISAVYKQPNGLIWVSTGKGLASIDEKNDIVKTYSSPVYSSPLLMNNLIYTIAQGNDKSIMFGSVGINQINFSREQFGFVFPNRYDSSSLHSFIVWKIHKGQKSGHYWIATMDGLEEMIFTNQTEQSGKYTLPVIFKHYNNTNKKFLSCNNVWDVFEDEKGWVWIATSCGLSIYDPLLKTYTNYIYNPNDKNSLGAKSVKCICQDSKKQIWLGTEGGGLNLFIEKEKRFERYRQKDGLPSDVIWGVMEDSAQNLWITTPLGLSRFNTKNKQVKNYGYAEGFQGDIFNRGAYYKDPDGRMYVGGPNGLNVFNPLEIKDHQVKPTIAFIGLFLFNKAVAIGESFNDDTIIKQSISQTKEIQLNYKNNMLGIEFVALHFLSPQKNKYAYMLEGYDTGWTYTSSVNRTVNYMNLPAGTYSFQVKASNADGVWSDTATSLTIIVLPPFWNTWWFRILLIVLTSIIIFGYVRFRIHEVERQNVSLEVMVKERTNEIEQQKEELATQADNLQEINYLLKDNQDKIMAQSMELQKANKALTQANVTKDTLFTIIAHDLKNPFQVILSTSQKLVNQFEQINEIKKLDYAHVINKSSNDIFLLLQNLLEWSRSQMNKIMYQPKSIELSRFCEEVIDVLQIQAKSKKISVNNNLQKGIFIHADRNMLSTVFRNLLSNAIKFNNIGGIVTINAYPIESRYEIIISDTGIGMDKETLEKLFNMEDHFSMSGTSGEQGTGLGLIICLEFIARNNGSIRVESNVGIGTNFIINLPASTEIDLELEMKNNDDSEDYSSEGIITTATIPHEFIKTNNIILLVEDNPIIRQNIKEFLQESFHVLEAENGKEGWLMALESIPDLIVSDVMMPEMDGISLCDKIKTDEKTNHIPMILLTASDSETNRIAGLRKGADDYLLKPFNTEVLLIRIINLIKIREDLKRKYNKEITNSNIPIEQTPDQLFLKKVVGIIEKNISNAEFSVEDLSGHLSMSYIQFYRKIEGLTGQAPGEIMRVVRLSKAAEIMLKNEGNVSQTAFEVGFKDPSYFAKSFKKHFGMSPTEYIKAQNVNR